MINVSQLVSLIYAYIKLTCVFVYYLATSTMLGTRAQQVPPSADESTQLLPEGPTSSISWERMELLMNSWFRERLEFRKQGPDESCSRDEVQQLQREWQSLIRSKEKAEQVHHFLTWRSMCALMLQRHMTTRL